MKMNVEFGSDNHSGVHPSIMKALVDANQGYSIAYGKDTFTKAAKRAIETMFGSETRAYIVYNGTAANIIALKTVTKSFNSIICANTAHLNVHECCGPEKFTGCKLTTVPTVDGKLKPELLKPYLVGLGDVHMAQPKVVSITQSTELGTTYSVDELKALCCFAHENNLLVHVDGARLCNAAVFLKKNLRAITKDVGVDILSFGGTKNGMMYGEAVIFFDRSLDKYFDFYQKQGMQLTSKMRYISTQFNAFLKDDLWKENAEHANKMAQYLKNELELIPQIKVVHKVEANMVFVHIPDDYMKKIRKKFYFHITEKDETIARLMCSFNTSKKSIDRLLRTIRDIMKE